VSTIATRLTRIEKILPSDGPCLRCPPSRRLIRVEMTGTDPGPAPRCSGCQRLPLESVIVFTDCIVGFDR
jgi:hypothetical protein